MAALQHAVLGASSSAKWLNCPGSIKMEEGMPDQVSEYAAEGITAHELAEFCLNKNEHAAVFIGHVFNGITVDDEMADGVQEYLNYVRNLKGHRFIEQRVDYSKWVHEGFGTADYICIQDNLVTVVDLKFGKGIKVDAEWNTQAMLYALGVLNDYDFLYDCERFKLVIVQPRLDHVSEWEISREDLLNFASYAKQQADLTLTDNPPINPSVKGCTFCRARSVCKPLAEHNLKLVAEEFADIDTQITPKDHKKLTNNEIAKLLPQLKLFSKWIKSVEAHAQGELEEGREVAGYKLVEGRSTRKWANHEEAEQALRRSKLKIAQIFSKNLISPTQAEKLLGKKHKIIQDHVIKPTGKPTICPVSDKRPAITMLGQDFQDVA